MRLLLWALLLLAPSPAVFADVIVLDPGQGPVDLPAGGTGASELSGLTWVSGSQWWVISDDTPQGARAYPLTLTIDSTTGLITGSPSLGPALQLAAGADPEGIAYQSPGILWVSDEVGPAIRAFATADGSLTATVVIPAVFQTVGTTAGVRPNLGLESLDRALDDSLWTANEEALYSDGEISTFDDGTIVRIQRFDAALNPAGQWGYITDPLPGDIGDPGRDVETSGVADMTVLPGGSVLVLERATGAVGLRVRIYLADLTDADDTSAMPALSVGNFTPAGKSLLWEWTIFDVEPHNFEGLALGPLLTDGIFSLLMVADDGGGMFPIDPQQSLYAVVAEESLFSDGFESGDTSRWTSTVP